MHDPCPAARKLIPRQGFVCEQFSQEGGPSGGDLQGKGGRQQREGKEEPRRACPCLASPVRQLWRVTASESAWLGDLDFHTPVPIGR